MLFVTLLSFSYWKQWMMLITVIRSSLFVPDTPGNGNAFRCPLASGSMGRIPLRGSRRAVPIACLGFWPKLWLDGSLIMLRSFFAIHRLPSDSYSPTSALALGRLRVIRWRSSPSQVCIWMMYIRFSMFKRRFMSHRKYCRPKKRCVPYVWNLGKSSRISEISTKME